MKSIASSRIFLGLLFISVGLFMFLDRLDIYSLRLHSYWPIFPSFLAVYFILRYIDLPEKHERLMPASILTVYSIIFWISESELNIDYEELWPLFIFAPALGLWLMHFLNRINKSYIMPAILLTTVSAFFLLRQHYDVESKYLVGIMFIIIGLLFVFKPKKVKEY
jgi:hypothetical protein